MNIPEIYLIEPYNAYAPKGKKKHWHQIVEEQELLARILAEQAAQQQALLEASSRTLPPNSPNVSSPTVGNMAGGAGGIPVIDFFRPAADVVDFSFTPAGGAGPLTIVFTNLTTTPQFDSYNWYFGDGVSSTDINPTHVYQSGSSWVSYTCSLQTTNSVTGEPGTSSVQYISASKPVVTAAFTYVTSSGPAPATASFTNTSTNTSQTPTTNYLWIFGDGTTATSTSPVHPYMTSSTGVAGLGTGSYTASLQATGSYGIASLYTQSFYVPAPTLAATFTFTTTSNVAPVTASFTSTTAYNGKGALTYKWIFGDGTTSALAAPVHPYTNSGSFTASLQVTESSYAIMSLSDTSSFNTIDPTLTAAFTFTTSSNSAPSTATFVNTLNGAGGTQYDGNGFLTYLWDLGTGSFTSTSQVPSPRAYTSAGPFTASLQVTESRFNHSSSYTQSWRIE